MPTVESEIYLLQAFSEAKVIGITLNHENMTDKDIDDTIERYENEFSLRTTDAMKKDPEKLVGMVLSAFPKLEEKLGARLGTHA